MEEIDDLNKFLDSHRIIQVDKTLAAENGSGYYVFCITFDDKRGQNDFTRKSIDYKEVLSDEEFIVFSQLREIRKQTAEKFGRPVYTVFTNEHLAKMVTGKVHTLEGMRKIDGIGDGKITDYAEVFLGFLQTVYKKEP